MNITFYSGFEKKINSTKLPAGASSQTVTGTLKEPCSILHPVVSLQKSPNTSYPPDFFRYAYIPLFSRYYWVTDWSWQNGLWTVSMTVDVLATYRSNIGDSNQYILRTDSSTTNFDGAITDTMYPATTNFDIGQIAFRNPFMNSMVQGTFIVGIICQTSSDAIGAITYYAMDMTEFGALKQMLFSNDNLEIMGIIDNLGNLQIGDMSMELFKTIYNPYQYIASCIWFPVDKTDIAGTQVTGINLGWWSYSTLTGKQLSQSVGEFFDGVEPIPVHPQAATRGKYLNYSPYTRLTLYGKFGSLPLDTSYMEIGSYLINSYLVDYITGECVFQVFIADNSSGTGRKLIAKTTFMIGTPIQIAQVGVDYLGTVASAVNAGGSMIGGAVSGFASGGVGGAIAGAITSGVSGIANTIAASMPQMMTSGANGSFITAQLSTVLTYEHFVIVDEDISHKGRPLCKVKKINTLTGYILCADGDIDLNAYDSEREEIRQYLTSGFFWE